MATSATLSAHLSVKQRYFEGFPVGYYDDLHPNPSLNFEMNRFSTGEPDMIEDMRSVSPKIHDLTDYTREFAALGEAALQRGEKLKGAYYLRSADFFMFNNDPRKQSTRRQYIQLMREHFGVTDGDYFDVPYETGAISAYRLPTPSQSKGTIVMFGGFDTYIEDWFPTLRYFHSAGYDMVLFDGPGPGSTIEDHRLPFTRDWHKPVGAVLDYFNLKDVTLWGISFGGCLVLRAAACEPRVRRVVCDDTCTDYFEVTLTSVEPSVRTELSTLLKLGADRVVDTAIERAMKADPFVDWGVHHGMLVMGSKTPSEYLGKLPQYRTDDVSHLIKQDVLVLGGTEDFCIPLHQFYDQIGMLTNARSLTARLFTKRGAGASALPDRQSRSAAPRNQGLDRDHAGTRGGSQVTGLSGPRDTAAIRLLAGTEDQFTPLHQTADFENSPINTRSATTRIFRCPFWWHGALPGRQPHASAFYAAREAVAAHDNGDQARDFRHDAIEECLKGVKPVSNGLPGHEL